MEVKVKHDKETILKGLECWSDSGKDCIKNDSCPYWKEQHSIVGCMYAIFLDTRQLIDEQDNEIENLKTLLYGYETGAICCKNCKHRPIEVFKGETPETPVKEYADMGWGEPEPVEWDYTCPYTCGDDWYNKMPEDDDFCSKFESKEE